MKTSAWLVIELRPGRYSGEVKPVISRVRKVRPVNELAVKVTLDIDPDMLQPHVEAMVEAGLLSLVIEEPPVEGEAL